MNRVERDVLAVCRSEGFKVIQLGGNKHKKIRLTKDGISFNYTYSLTPSERRCGLDNFRTSLRRRFREVRDMLAHAQKNSLCSCDSSST